ncbi:leucyl aminopeptidase [Candidatus Gracilibacteria bacterium]|nr:leucyl aminopeptidase [Candidatus Gracilibacteria bacterium]
MKIISDQTLSSSDALFVFIPEKKWDKKPYGKLLSTSLEKEIQERMNSKDFEGKMSETLRVFHVLKEAKKIFFVGVGKEKEPMALKKAAGAALREAKKTKAKKVVFLLPEGVDSSKIILGAILGSYEFKIGDKKDSFDVLELKIVQAKKMTSTEISRIQALGDATNLTRELVNLPANYMTPSILAQKAQALTKGLGNPIKVKVYGNKDLLKFKMGSLFGVGQGSTEESKLIVLEYMGGKKNETPIALVGKGVCFDSGGYNLKPTNHIETMKSDMAGAAAMLGIFSWLRVVKPKKNIVAVLGAVENLISGSAFKPGDILTSMSGKTIEITNTDAEGRLVLADCLYYAATKYKPAYIIDAATLTGAAIAALGYEITSIMGNNEKLMSRFKKSAEMAEEMVWEMPITETFRKKTKGEIADLLNWTAGVSAGSSMGGAFLEHFVEKTPWIHLDLGGTAFHESWADEITPKGATGVMVQTLAHFLEN